MASAGAAGDAAAAHASNPAISLAQSSEKIVAWRRRNQSRQLSALWLAAILLSESYGRLQKIGNGSRQPAKPESSAG